MKRMEIKDIISKYREILSNPQKHKTKLIYLGMELLKNIPEIDIREKDKELISLMQKTGWRLGYMSVADYGYKDILGVERKSGDLLTSTFTGKLFQQVQELKDNYEHVFLMIDKSLDDVLSEATSRGIPENVIYGLVASLAVRGVPPLFVGNRYNFSKILQLLYVKCFDGKDRTVHINRNISAEDIIISQLIQLPGITEQRARLLLNIFERRNRIELEFYTMYADNEYAHLFGLNARVVEEVIRVMDNNV